MKIFGLPPSKPCHVANGRFELDHDGKTAFLNYAYDGHVLELIHTEVPEELRGSGTGSQLAHAALEWAREHHAKVDIICSFVAKYVREHPEYADLVVK